MGTAHSHRRMWTRLVRFVCTVDMECYVETAIGAMALRGWRRRPQLLIDVKYETTRQAMALFEDSGRFSNSGRDVKLNR